MSKYQELKQQIRELEKARLEVAKTAFREDTVALFEKFPKLEQFSWKQYTPHFNDGDPCYFGVHADPDYGLTINGKSYEEWGESAYDDNGKLDEEVANSEQYKLDCATADAVSSLVNSFETADLESMFGEGQVDVYRDGTIESDYCDHD